MISGQPSGHTKISASRAIYDAWNVSLNVLVVTERTNSPTYHCDFTSKVINALGDDTNYNTGSLMPYHYIARADFQGSVPNVETDNRDLSALSFALSVWVRPEAWP